MSNLNDFLNSNESIINAAKNIQRLNNYAKTNSALPEMPKIRNPLLAKYQFEILKKSIEDFEAKLDNKHEVALKLASFGQTVTMNVTEIGYSGSSILFFRGYVGNNYAELIQHVTQLNFLMMVVKKQDPKKEPRRIGFIQPNQTSPSDSE